VLCHLKISDLISLFAIEMKCRLIKYFTLYMLACFFRPTLLIAQDYPIKYLGIEQGLSNNSVRCIYQDSKGFMWFGTYDGLNRYDGYEFKIFRNKFTDSSSIINNWIYTITEDSDGDLWVGTRQGISTLHKQSGNFSPLYYKSSSNNSLQKVTAVIKSIKGSEDGKVFVGSQTLGLLVFDKKNSYGVKINIEGQTESNYEVQSIKIAEDKTVWLFVQGFGLGIFDSRSSTIKIIDQSVKTANCIEINGNDIWIGSNAGVYRYNVVSKKNEQVFNKANGTLPSDIIVGITLDKNKDLWLSSNGGGITILRTASDKLEYIGAGVEKKSLSSESVYTVFEDKDLRKWVGTLRGGINVIDSHKSKFTTISYDPLNPGNLSSNFIYSFYEATNGHLWIGTDGGGISVWDRQKNLFHNYKAGITAGALKDNSITTIVGDYHNNIWLGTFFNGIDKFNVATNQFEHYPCINPANGQINKTIYTLYEDRQHNLFAGALRSAEANGALYIFNEQLNKFEVFDTKLPDIFVMKEDKSGKLWGGDLTHLILIDTKKKQHQFYDIGTPVHSIYEDNKGDFWVGTEGGGLILFDRKNGKIISRYTTEQGLCNNTVLNILDDNNGNLWLSTFNGLSRFGVEKRQPKNYYYADGLQSNQFTYNAAIKLHSGEMVFGGIKGLNIFYPKDISSSGTFSKLVMSEIKVDNTPLEENKAQIFSQDRNGITLLNIPYNKAIVSFDFTALEYSSADKISYMYYMEGWDKGWTSAGTTRTATYTHLDEGSYTFRVKSTNVAGDWNPQELTVRITILPPWYRTWWAYVLYGLTITGILIFIYYYRVKQNRLKYEATVAKITAEKERSERQMKQAELEKEMAEHEKDKAEDAKKIAEKETERVK
jgi:ligand-binding sensor domain-containing protein